MSKFHPKQASLQKIESVFSEIDFNNDGTINFSEFITVTMEKEKLLTEDNLKRAFKMFDIVMIKVLYKSLLMHISLG